MTGSVIANLTWLVVSFHATKTGRIGREENDILAKDHECSVVGRMLP